MENLSERERSAGRQWNNQGKMLLDRREHNYPLLEPALFNSIIAGQLTYG